MLFDEAILAGGCFWCTEAVFRRLKGVISVTPGYTGGSLDNPNYEAVSTGNSGHAEAVQIKYDPQIISYEKLLEVFWALHNPTTLNQQGSDIGTQYRSAIFYLSEDQKIIAERSKANIDQSGNLYGKVVTAIEPANKFYPAENYHQAYYEINRNTNPYCSIVIDPKIKKLLTEFNEEVKEEYK